MKKFALIAVAFAVLVAGIALAGGNITTVYYKTATTTGPSVNTDGTPLNTVGTSVPPDPGQPVTRAQVTLYNVGDIVGGRVNMWRFVQDAGWARDYANDIIILDGGPNTAGSPMNAGATTVGPIVYHVNGRNSRIDATVSGILQWDGGVGVPKLLIETTWH